MNEICMRCGCNKDEHQIYHFESGCWCSKCIDSVMSASRGVPRATPVAAQSLGERSSLVSDIIQMAGHQFTLTRTKDGKGTFGPMLEAMEGWSHDARVGEIGELRIGCCCRVGSGSGRYWHTTPIVEFLEVRPDNKWVKFRTANSIYTVEAY